ncbi:MAG: ATP-dependent DNA helicase [Gemmatimonadota bacterium]|nr:ATP-dependent DNA helicase [Gemmatimonadota bacterium]
MIAPLDLVAAATRLVLDDYADEDPAPSEAEHVRPVRLLDADDVSADLGPDGLIARAMRRFEDRPTQREMAHAVVGLYNAGGVGLLEAGTGVGKSLGYLVPALRWAAANGERTVVSTNTINLQEQLVRKDLPFLRDALAPEQAVRFALLKGWRNYLCKLRLAQATLLGPTLLDDDTSEGLDAIRVWAETTVDGSLSDLRTPPRGEVWDEVAAEPDLCTRNACPHYQDCFLFRARREAAQADVVVVNHHLLMSDVAVRRAAGNWEDAAVIPPYTRLVIDEGHHLEDAASAHLGVTTSRRSLNRLFGRLERRGRGLVNTLIEQLSASRDLLGTASLDVVTQRIVPAVRASREKSDLLFDLLLAVLHQCGAPVLRMGDDFAQHPVWKGGLHMALTDLLRELRVLGESLTLVSDRLQGGGQRDDAMLLLVNELRAVARRLDDAAEGLMLALRPPAAMEPMVRWLEVKGREGNVAVTAVPLDLAPILRDDLFTRVKTAVVTSATLGTDGDFGFVARRFGLDGRTVRPVSAVFASPFDYQSQALLVIPTDIPAPNEDAAAHFAAVLEIIEGAARASGGGMFALFTSHRDVRAAADALRRNGVGSEFTLLVHGEDGRDALLSRFRDSGDAILLGTSSYWEGVDVPGSALRALVIARLPFRVPSEPVTAAQCEAITARGGDAFSEYMLPHASLRLKQGFGRLIRSASDRGAIVIADPRVISKRYGRDLLRDLPPARRMTGAWGVLERQLQRFYSIPSASND